MLGAGLEGIKNGYKLGKPTEENIFHMSEKERKKLKIVSLPDTLENALHEFEESKLMREVLGDHIFNSLIANKRKEWDLYRTQVTDYEINAYYRTL
jgi:glutamine synthetase